MYKQDEQNAFGTWPRTTSSDELVHLPPPGGPGGLALPLLLEVRPVNLTATSVNVDLGELEPGLALPEVATNVENNDDEEGKVGLEEGNDVEGLDGDVELEDEDDDDDDETDP